MQGMRELVQGGGTDIQGMRDLGGLNAGSEGPGAALQGVRDLGAEMQEVRELRGCHPESKRPGSAMMGVKDQDCCHGSIIISLFSCLS